MSTDINNVSDKQLFERLFRISIDWLRKEKRRDFYQKVVEFCAALLESEVCALFVRTTQIDNTPRVCLVAGKLPPGHPKGQRMDPNEVGHNPRDHSYRIGEIEKGRSGEPVYDGVTGKIATTGEPANTGGYIDISEKTESHVGRWDNYVWQGEPRKRFKCMLGVPIRAANKGLIGVIKVENKKSGKYDDNDKKLLEHIGSSLSGSLLELIEEKRELNPEIEECEYRVPRSTPSSFEKKKTGEVIIKHSMTAICRSDLHYFSHKKSREKLDERLPLVLGHETTGEVYEVVGENKYHDGTIIQPKDKVVIIPLIPCGTCKICKGGYGENYCPSSRFMASNAPGSLRTIYKYYPDLMLKIKKPEFEKYALFTEPMSNVVQILDELGFKEGNNAIELNMAPFEFGQQEFTYFHVPKDSFSNIFDSITAEEPYPRTLFLLKNPHNSPLGRYDIRHNNITSKGLGLLGIPTADAKKEQELTKKFQNPKILILGGGVEGYILAVLLSNVFGIKKEQLVTTGRNFQKLDIFKRQNLSMTKSVKYFLRNDGTYAEEPLAEELINEGDRGEYDIVFECVGQPATEQNIDLALRVLKPGGVIGMLGLDDKPIKIDFETLLEKNIFIKGFYRGSLSSYRKSLNYIETFKEIRNNLESLIDSTAEVNGQQVFHSVKNSADLERLFCAARDKFSFGRLVINNLY